MFSNRLHDPLVGPRDCDHPQHEELQQSSVDPTGEHETAALYSETALSAVHAHLLPPQGHLYGV